MFGLLGMRIGICLTGRQTVDRRGQMTIQRTAISDICASGCYNTTVSISFNDPWWTMFRPIHPSGIVALHPFNNKNMYNFIKRKHCLIIYLPTLKPCLHQTVRTVYDALLWLMFYCCVGLMTEVASALNPA